MFNSGEDWIITNFAQPLFDDGTESLASLPSASIGVATEFAEDSLVSFGVEEYLDPLSINPEIIVVSNGEVVNPLLLRDLLIAPPSRFTVPLFWRDTQEAVVAGFRVQRFSEKIGYMFESGDFLLRGYTPVVPSYEFLLYALSDRSAAPEILFEMIQRRELGIIRAPNQSRQDFHRVRIGLMGSPDNFVIDSNDHSIIRLQQEQDGSLLYYARVERGFVQLLDSRFIEYYLGAVPVSLALPELSESTFNLSRFELELATENIFAADAARNYLSERGVLVLTPDEIQDAQRNLRPVGRISFLNGRAIVDYGFIYNGSSAVFFHVPNQGAEGSRPSGFITYIPNEGVRPRRVDYFELATDEERLSIIKRAINGSGARQSVTIGTERSQRSLTRYNTQMLISFLRSSGYRLIDAQQGIPLDCRIIAISININSGTNDYLVLRYVDSFFEVTDDNFTVLVVEPDQGTGLDPKYRSLVSADPYGRVPLIFQEINEQDALESVLFFLLSDSRIIERMIINRITELLDGDRSRNPLIANRSRYSRVLTRLRDQVIRKLRSEGAATDEVVARVVDTVINREARRFRAELFREFRRNERREISDRIRVEAERRSTRGI